MAKIKRNVGSKTKGADQPAAKSGAQWAKAVPAVVPAAVPHPSGAAVTIYAKPSVADGAHIHGDDWQATGDDADEGDEDNAWGEPATEPANLWEEPTANGSAAGLVSPTAGNWGSESAGQEWEDQQRASTSTGPNGFALSRHSKPGGAEHNPQPPTPQAPALTSFHPSATAHMSPQVQGWGGPAPVGWHDSETAWGPPAAETSKPAWTNWVNEAKIAKPSPDPAHSSSYGYATQNAPAAGGTRQVLSELQRSQILNSILEDPHQQTKGNHPQSQLHHNAYQRQQPAFHPSQQAYPPSKNAYLDHQLVAEQQNILRSIQEQNARQTNHAHQGHPHAAQHANDWGHLGKEGWGGERASTIPEEEEYDENEGWGDGYDDTWGASHDDGTNQHVRFSSNVAYAGQAQSVISRGSRTSRTPSRGPFPDLGASPSLHGVSPHPQMWAPFPISSRTMKMATGTLPTPTGSVKTTVFELMPPRNGLGENSFFESHGKALQPAERALYNRARPAKERFRWGFPPEKDQRVGSLLRWVDAMSNGLATIGLQRFLESRERGALFANADFRVPTTVGAPSQPAFDWVPLSDLQHTLDSTLQSSVTLYDPAFQVVVFVFLLSPSGNSMAVWRRKLDIPDELRDAHQGDIFAVKAELKHSYPVYVDELPVRPDATIPNVPPKKKKVRFAFVKRLFGGRKKTVATT